MVDVVTTQLAAARLGVHPSRVRALIASGALTATRAGGQWLVDLGSLDRHLGLVSAGATGRPFATRTAWAAAQLCDGLPDGLGAAERYRLRNRLAQAAGTDGLCQIAQRWLSRRAGSAQRYRIGEGDIAALLDTPGVLATGISTADVYGLGLSSGGSADAYVDEDTHAELVDGHYLIASPHGNLTLRVADFSTLDALRLARRSAGLDTGATAAAAPRLLAGVDLAEDTDTRTRAAGCTLISDALRAAVRVPPR